MEGQNAIIGVASVAMGWRSEGAFSPTFTSLLNIPLISLYIMVCTPSSLTFQPRKYGLYCLGCEPSALDVPSFFSMPIEGCYFGEVARHLYEQKREFECIPFYPSCVGLLVQAISTRLWPSVKTFRTHRHKHLCLWKKKAALSSLWSGHCVYATKTPCTSNPVHAQTTSAILEEDRITHCWAPSHRSSYGHAISYLAHRSLTCRVVGAAVWVE